MSVGVEDALGRDVSEFEAEPGPGTQWPESGSREERVMTGVKGRGLLVTLLDGVES